MDPKFLKRIIDEAGGADLMKILAGRLSGADLNSLLLEVFRRRTAAGSPDELLQNYIRNPLVRPGKIDPRILRRLDAAAFDLVPPGFEALDLSPVAPLGTCSSVAPVSQNVVLSALRGTEIVSDATNVLALECARRRRALAREGRAKETVRLCAAHKHLRTQPFVEEYFSPHFSIFTLATAGRDTGNAAFDAESLKEHLRFHLRLLLKLLPPERGIEFSARLTDFEKASNSRLEGDVLVPLAGEFPRVHLAFDPARTKGRGYYDRICFQIGARFEGAGFEMIVDGGFTDWVSRLLQDRKERFLASGVGLTYLWNILGQRMAFSEPTEGSAV